jgi:hypothetical protein
MWNEKRSAHGFWEASVSHVDEVGEACDGDDAGDYGPGEGEFGPWDGGECVDEEESGEEIARRS